ncbi:hypothetical protein CR513_03727, partial [Mucuna pruriens]
MVKELKKTSKAYQPLHLEIMVVDPRVSSIGNQSFQSSSSSWIQVEKHNKMKNSMKLWANFKRKHDEYVDLKLIVDQILQRLHQGPYSVEEYHKEMEMDLNLSELVYQAIKVEIQLRRKSASRKTAKRERRIGLVGRSPKKGSEASIGRKELTPIPTPIPPRISSIKCFKCLGKEHIAS